MKDTIFKAYDIRGKYLEDITVEGAYLIGRSYGSYLQQFCDKKKCVVGHDNRLSSPLLNNALIEGLLASGINVIDYGLITTPMHYYTRYLEHTYGIMVTASHNPKEDNGFKFSFDEVSNARGEMIQEFKEYTFQNQFLSGRGILEHRDVRKAYLNYMKENVFLGSRPLKVVVDPGNGVTTTIVKDIFSLFPTLDVTYICDENDGTFPNHHPDPAVEENLSFLKAKVFETHADLGIAYDGDGDRFGIIDELGHFVMADQVMIVVARALMHEFSKKTIVCDVKCSKALIDEVEALGGTVLMSRTGTSFTQCLTKESHSPFGGELSGHIFFNDRGIELCSGIYDSLRILEILSKQEKGFSQLLENVPFYESTPELKIPCENERKFSVVEKVKSIIQERQISYLDIDGIRFQMDDAWGLIRASNTGPNLTLRFEAKTKERLEEIKKEFTDLVMSQIS